MKVCAKCKTEKPFTEFYQRPQKKCGYRSRCIPCETEDRAEREPDAIIYRKERADKKRDYDKKRRHEKREEIAAAKKIQYENNKDHYLAYRKQWAILNPEKQRAIRTSHCARRRQWKRGGDSTRLIREWEVLAAKVCYWCGKACQGNHSIDHYQPLSKGGMHEVSNLVISCLSCNKKKNAKDPYEYAASLGRLF